MQSPKFSHDGPLDNSPSAMPPCNAAVFNAVSAARRSVDVDPDEHAGALQVLLTLY